MNAWAEIKQATNAQVLAWAETQSWARSMAACAQDAQWHAEGDVWTHTRMARGELERLTEWQSLNRIDQLKLLFTALFHDSGKPATTALDPETGAAIVRELKAIGYRYVTLDLQGYRTGSLNEGLLLRPT